MANKTDESDEYILQIRAALAEAEGSEMNEIDPEKIKQEVKAELRARKLK